MAKRILPDRGDIKGRHPYLLRRQHLQKSRLPFRRLLGYQRGDKL